MLYMPACLEGRFAKEGVAQAIEMPSRSRRLGPTTYATIPLWAPFISCPPDCRGYENRTIATVKSMFKKGPQTEVKSGESASRKWDWKFWLGVICVPIALVVVGAVLAWLTPEGRRWLGLDKTTSETATSAQSKGDEAAPEIVSFYGSNKYTEHEKETILGDFDNPVLIHWEVTNPRGKLYLRTISLQGFTVDSKEVPQQGIERFQGVQTLDYFLEEDVPGAHRKTLASLRVRMPSY